MLARSWTSTCLVHLPNVQSDSPGKLSTESRQVFSQEIHWLCRTFHLEMLSRFLDPQVTRPDCVQEILSDILLRRLAMTQLGMYPSASTSSTRTDSRQNNCRCSLPNPAVGLRVENALLAHRSGDNQPRHPALISDCHGHLLKALLRLLEKRGELVRIGSDHLKNLRASAVRRDYESRRPAVIDYVHIGHHLDNITIWFSKHAKSTNKVQTRIEFGSLGHMVVPLHLLHRASAETAVQLMMAENKYQHTGTTTINATLLLLLAHSIPLLTLVCQNRSSSYLQVHGILPKSTINWSPTSRLKAIERSCMIGRRSHKHHSHPSMKTSRLFGRRFYAKRMPAMMWSL